MTQNQDLYANVYRTPIEGCYELTNDEWWGTYLRKIPDPTANMTHVPDSSFELKKDFNKIPSGIWTRIVRFFWKYAKDSLEVMVRLYRNEEGTIWRCLVPYQEVSVASVNFDYEKGLCDIETGEITGISIPGFIYAGTFH